METNHFLMLIYFIFLLAHQNDTTAFPFPLLLLILCNEDFLSLLFAGTKAAAAAADDELFDLAAVSLLKIVLDCLEHGKDGGSQEEAEETADLGDEAVRPVQMDVLPHLVLAVGELE